jgi:hypothetical protein
LVGLLLSKDENSSDPVQSKFFGFETFSDTFTYPWRLVAFFVPFIFTSGDLQLYFGSNFTYFWRSVAFLYQFLLIPGGL